MTKFIKLSKYPIITFSSIIILLLAISTSVTAQNIEEGEKLYKANCTACHQIDNKLIGPALRGVSDKYSEEWLIKWIKNSAELIASGDADAIAIYEEYNKSPMTAFPYFSDDDVRNILAYVEQAPEKQAVAATASAAPRATAAARPRTARRRTPIRRCVRTTSTARGTASTRAARPRSAAPASG